MQIRKISYMPFKGSANKKNIEKPKHYTSPINYVIGLGLGAIIAKSYIYYKKAR